MMHLLPSILASDDDIPFKLIFWVIVLIIWGISSAVSAMKKKFQALQQTTGMQEVPIELTPRMEVRPPVLRAVQAPVLLRPGAQRIAVPQRAAQAIAVSAPPRVRVPAGPPPLTPVTQKAAPKKVARPEPLPDSAPSAALQLSRQLRPDSLRTQWLMTEILAKPLALRQNDGLGPS